MVFSGRKTGRAVSRKLTNPAIQLLWLIWACDSGRFDSHRLQSATKLAFMMEPTAVMAGAVISPAVAVTVQDADGNSVMTASPSITVGIGNNPGGGKLSGITTVTAASGVATFPDLSLDTSGRGYTLTADATGLSGAITSPFDVSLAPAKLAFSVQPSATISGTAIAPAVRVVVQDAQGNPVTLASPSITVAIGTNPAGGTLLGTATVPALNGVATFSNLSIDHSGAGYTLTATSSGLTGATSVPFQVFAPPSQLAFTVQPSTTAAAVAIAPAIRVAVQDAQGNTVTLASPSITVAIGTNPGGGTLSGTTTIAAVNGVATFSNLSIDRPGYGYTLTAASSGLTGATSVTFNVQGVSFRPAVEYVGYSPAFVVVDDFNRDGKWDLAVANDASSSITVWLGNGDGSFHFIDNFLVGGGSTSIAVGDFNGDGWDDLAVANYQSWNVSVLLGNGDGTFQAAMNLDTGGYTTFVVAGDFNGDGKLDLAVTVSIAKLLVLLGNGDGHFRAAMQFDTEATAYSMSVGDFNGDGALDLAMAPRFGEDVLVLLGNGDGTFQAPMSFHGGGYTPCLAIGDFNRDRVLDLAVSYDEGVSVLLGNGDGTFQAAMNFGAGVTPASVAVGDFNADGVPDLAVANFGYCPEFPCEIVGNVSVLLGIGDGRFRAPVNFANRGGNRSVATADFNGDGLPDLAVARTVPVGLSVLINDTHRQ
jgi:hypothetical protein